MRSEFVGKREGGCEGEDWEEFFDGWLRCGLVL